MNHEQVLNELLANTCGKCERNENGIMVFEYDLCCKKAVVVAKLVETDPIKYEVLSFDIVNPWDEVSSDVWELRVAGHTSSWHPPK